MVMLARILMVFQMSMVDTVTAHETQMEKDCLNLRKRWS